VPDRLLLCTDLDRTLIPNGPDPESPGSRDHFAQLAADSRVVLAYVTGRHRQLVEEAVREYRLPRPNFVIGDVGTTLYRIDESGDWQLDATWEAQINRDWNGFSHRDLEQLLAAVPGLQLQEAHKQNRHKLSYYVATAWAHEEVAAEITRCLTEIQVNARLVWSVDELARLGLLDVLPAAASKYHAVVHLQRQLGFTDTDTVFSGDSGNDIDVLASAIPAVLVANSAPAVQAEVLALAAARGRGASLYIAHGNFNGLNGNYSAGILEGIAYYHPAVTAWMGLGAVA
jgi:HAD superfamily hydrolase (TIGR01484 family)